MACAVDANVLASGVLATSVRQRGLRLAGEFGSRRLTLVLGDGWPVLSRTNAAVSSDGN